MDKKVNMASDYSYEGENNSYYNSNFTYNFTGYHPGEIYRFGIVYIRKDNSFTSVFDVLGINDMKTKGDLPIINFENIDLEESKPYCTSGTSVPVSATHTAKTTRTISRVSVASMSRS